MNKFNNAIVIGAGAFGTSIASILSHNFKQVYLKVRSQDVYDSLINNKNEIYLPGLTLPSNLIPILSWDDLKDSNKDNVELIVSGLPTAGIHSFFSDNFDYIDYFIKKDIPLVSLSKGIDPNTLDLPDDLFFNLWPSYKESFIFLSGPSFAKEIVEKQITMVTVAGRSKSNLKNLCKMMNTDYFKLLNSYDVKGVLLGGALKNVVAIAGGIVEGLGFNHNTRAALITRAIAEMLKYGKVYNARPETFYGLAGMGDLILTTTGGLSRNKQFGLEIAKGRKPKEIIESQRSVVEGYKTTLAAHLVSEKYGIKTRIFESVYQVLYHDLVVSDAIDSIMKIPSSFEIE